MLSDAGALVALFNDQDQYHQAAIEALNQRPTPTLLTTLPCFTETAQQISSRNPRQPKTNLYRRLIDGTIQIHQPTLSEIKRAATLALKYRNIPMSFADASLIAAAETLNQHQIFTYDSDFQIYRLNDRDPVDIIR